MHQLNNFYLNQPEPNRSCLLALRNIILDQDREVNETMKYGMPCFCYRKIPFCYLWTDKKTTNPYILLVEGKHIDHPALETGQRSRMKILKIDPNLDLPISNIGMILRQALDLYRDGKLKPK